MLLTKNKTFIIGWVSSILGYIMNAIFTAQSSIGIENIGLCIILFTIVIYLLMTPLTFQQQKFSKMSAKMNPELQAIQKKYKGKNNDQAAMAKMNEETQAVYAKYGVNPMGSCVQLVIQMPILFALYRVIWNIPAYVTRVKDVFMPLADALMKTSGAQEYLTEVAGEVRVAFPEMTNLTIIDLLYKFKPSNWAALSEKFPDLTSVVESTQKSIDKMNYFLGLNIADSPWNIFTQSLSEKKILIMIAAIMVPVLAALTQWINGKLMTNMNDNGAAANNASDSMASSMKTMNTMMPLMSAFFCLTLPVGLGIYWIAGAVVRSIQQVLINKQLDKTDIDELMRKNLEKMNKKREKMGLSPQKMNANANISTRNIDVPVNKNYKKELQEKVSNLKDEPAVTKKKAKPGSLAEKAMMVQEYNEKNRK